MRLAKASLGEYGDLSCLGWQDTKPVHIVSTGISTNQCTILRRVKGNKNQIPVSSANVINRYQRYMGGVDRNDYLRMSRYSVQTSNVTKKWYKLFFSAMIDLCLVNSFILWKIMNRNSRNSSEHGWFQEQVAIGLLNTRMVSRSRSSTPTGTRSAKNDNTSHKIVRYDVGEGYQGREKRYRRCFVCQYLGFRSMSEHYCNTCNVCVCVKLNALGQLCWNELHSNICFEERIKKRQTKMNSSTSSLTEPHNRSTRDIRKRKRSAKDNQNTPKKGKSRNPKGKTLVRQLSI